MGLLNRIVRQGVPNSVSGEFVDTGGWDRCPLGEVMVVSDVCLGLTKEAGREPGAEDAVDSQRGQGCGLVFGQMRRRCRDPVGQFRVESVDELCVGGVEARG